MLWLRFVYLGTFIVDFEHVFSKGLIIRVVKLQKQPVKAVLNSLTILTGKNYKQGRLLLTSFIYLHNQLINPYVTTTGNFECFYYFIFETNFLKNENFFKNLEYRFLVQSAATECAIFPFKTVVPKANVKTNRMGSTKWIYYKGRSFTSNYFIFLNFFFSV